MLDPTIYHPRFLQYKSPFGAVTVKTDIRFHIRRPEGADSCILQLYAEFADRHTTLPMTREGDGFSVTFTAPEQPELIWYSFAFPDLSLYYGADGFSDAPFQDVPSFQLTVYDGTRSTPDWFGRGVTYQIFPDRFCRLSVPDVSNMIGNRIIHQNWNELPAYLPENGVITNRDFFGGSLKGILSRLDYLETLNVTTIYLNPIFEAASNHRYDTCDYKKIDPLAGTEEDFRLLCHEAKKHGMRIILDGVFNHTGNGSRYFNAYGWYPDLGAAQSQDSPYSDWYDFSHWPDAYSCWWGIDTLPQVNESTAAYMDYIINDEDSVVRRYLRMGASGWRLDVADELPDEFIAALRDAAAEERPDAVIIGEVWEDGSNKIAYDQRRKYLLGNETHGLMNYPFRNEAIAWLQGGDAHNFMETMETLREHYPPAAYYSAMNSLGTHDTPRALTLLAPAASPPPATREARAHYRLNIFSREKATRRLLLGATLLYTFPGSPTVFYGDEAGMEGFEDPFNRGTFPWDGQDQVILSHYRALGRLRRERRSLQEGDIVYFCAKGGLLVYRRSFGGETVWVALNNDLSPVSMSLPYSGRLAKEALTGQRFVVRDGLLRFTLPPEHGMIFI